MTKEALKNTLIELKLDSSLQAKMFALIDDAPVVNQELLNTIADILDLDSMLDEQEANISEFEAANYKEIVDKVNVEKDKSQQTIQNNPSHQ